jgi:PST family polysaccharide transporter
MNLWSKIINKPEKKVLVSNFLALGIVQGLNFLLPLLVVPYLLYTLGIEIFGLLAMATAFSSYFMILSDYGFNITATREISIHREHSDKLNEIFSAVMMIKIVLMCIGFSILLLSLWLFDSLAKDALIYLLTFGMVIGEVLFPIWFFQGIEKMRYIAILNIVAKLFFLLAIFIFVKVEEDAYLVPLFNSLGFILVGMVSLFYIYKEFDIRFVWQPYSVLRRYLIMGWHIFLSKLAVTLYSSSNIFILGLFTNHLLVGYYAVAYKVVSALVSLGDIINQVIFPYLSKKWMENREVYYELFYRFLKGIIAGMFFFSLILFFTAEEIVYLLAGEETTVTVELLKIMSLFLIIAPLGGLYSQSFVTQGKSVYVTKSTFWTLCVNMLLIGILIPLYGVYGLAIAEVLVKVFHFYLNNLYFIRLRKVAECVA